MLCFFRVITVGVSPVPVSLCLSFTARTKRHFAFNSSLLFLVLTSCSAYNLEQVLKNETKQKLTTI